MTDPSTETAYILVSESRLALVANCHADPPPIQRRLAVTFSDDDAKPSHDSQATQHACPCRLRYHWSDDDILELDWRTIPAFSGSESDVLCTECQQPRSDTVLLLGLLKVCRDCFTLQRTEIIFHEPKDDNQNMVVSIFVALSFPLLQQGTPGSRFLLAVHPPKLSKPLSAALQLLLSIVQCDWDALENAMDRLVTARPTAPPGESVPSFFPTKISLHELYRRIPGSSQNNHRLDNVTSKEAGTIKEAPDLLSLVALPKEILIDNLAPFLRAKSLDALRCTCSTMHQTLQAVVPGLKLRLYSHQVASLTWMRQRECRALVEADCLQPPSRGGKDLHRAVTGGGTTLLQSADAKIRIRIHQGTGREVNEEELVALPRKVARGGLLCDDPGLGKSITLLSLILQTNGLTTALERADAEGSGGDTVSETLEDECDDESEFFNAYWTEHITSEFQKPLLRRLFNNLLRHNRHVGRLSPAEAKSVSDSIDKDMYRHNFGLFEGDVRAVLDHFRPYEEGTDCKTAVLSTFQILVSELKEDQLRSAKKSFANTGVRPNSRVTAMVQRRKEKELLRAMVATSATLLVVPSVLLDHWKKQIALHLDTTYLVEPGKQPLTFVFDQKKKGGLSVDRALLMIKLYKTHSPFVFLDMAPNRPLPPPDFLSLFRVVITSNQRFRNEWSNGSFEKEIERTANSDASYAKFYLHTEETAACPLLKIHWLRMVVDEGHSMAQDKQSSTIQFASWISAERRWVMTGTPTKHTNAQIAQLKNLMAFLQHEFFTPRLEGDRVWQSSVARLWNDRSLVALFRLKELLGLLMKRHTKLDIAELPFPLYRREVISMSSVEVATYNAIVCAVQINLLVCSMGGKPMGEQDSLLHRSQRKFAKEGLDNIRRTCTGYSRVVPTLTTSFFEETLELLEIHGISEERIQRVREQMVAAQEEELRPCDCCGLRLSTLLVLPCCGGLACPECMDSSNVCTLCLSKFDVNDFQKLQPGFVLSWKSNVEEQANKLEASSNHLPVINGAVRDGRESLAAASNNGQNHELPLIRPPQERRPVRKYGDHECEFDLFAVDGKCTLCRHEHGSCILMNDKRRCPTCHRAFIPCPDEESKAHYLVQTLRKLHAKRYRYSMGPRSDCPRDSDERPLKAIVFSQFRGVLNVIGTRLIWEFGGACVAEFWGKTRQAELKKFETDSDCFCMLLSKDGSEGLDLSFVTNVFFLEEILDKSLMEQAVARAWRMGATGRVDVETIIARNTVEETMQDVDGFLQGDPELTEKYAALRDFKTGKPDQLSKTHFLLKSLRLLTDYHYFAEIASAPVGGSGAHRVDKGSPVKRLLTMEGHGESEHRDKRVRFA